MALSKQQVAAQLVGAAEAAVILGVTRSTISSYLAREQILQPLVMLACGPIWLRDDLERWQAQRKNSRQTLR